MRSLLVKQTRYGNRGHNFKDLTGKKYGKLTVVSLDSTNKIGTKWILQCECGNVVTRLASNFKRSKHRHSCGCVSTNPGKPDAGFRRMFGDYRQSAKLRGYSFSLSYKTFRKLIGQKCYYCAADPVHRYSKQIAHKILANGIDRVDNTAGYSVSNSVTCCSKCNRAKAEMSQKEFLTLVTQIFNNRVIGG